MWEGTRWTETLNTVGVQENFAVKEKKNYQFTDAKHHRDEIIKIQAAESSAVQTSVSSTNKSQGEKMEKKSTDEESSEEYMKQMWCADLIQLAKC